MMGGLVNLIDLIFHLSSLLFLIRFLLAPHRVNFHLEHHLFMMCPWYNLPKAHSMMIDNG